MGVEVDVVLYMKNPPDKSLLERITQGLEGPVEDLVRKDSQFKKLELEPSDYVDNSKAVVELLASRKALLQRPILIRGDLNGEGPLETCVGRPRDKIRDFFESDKSTIK